jgi:putative hydrolase of the HAD superfamily
VSEKDAATYARLFDEFDLQPHEFAMVGNSLRSDIAPVIALGGWGVYMPYHVTWAHEAEAEVADDEPRLRRVDDASGLPAALADIAHCAGIH